MAFILYDKYFTPHMIVASAQDALDIAFWDIEAEWKITRLPNWRYRQDIILLVKKINDSDEKWVQPWEGGGSASPCPDDTIFKLARKTLKDIPIYEYCMRKLGGCPVENFESNIEEYKKEHKDKKIKIYPEIKMNFIAYKKAYPLEWRILFRYHGAIPEIFVKNHPELDSCTLSEYKDIVSKCLANPDPRQDWKSLVSSK